MGVPEIDAVEVESNESDATASDENASDGDKKATTTVALSS